MTSSELADRIRLIMKSVESVYGQHGGVAAEVKAGIIMAAAISLAMESTKEKEDGNSN